MATTLPVTEGFDEHTENVMVWSNHPGILALAPRSSYDQAELSTQEVVERQERYR